MSSPEKILAVETSTRRAAVALGTPEGAVEQVELPESTRPTESLVSTIDQLFRSVGWEPMETDLVAVNIGPGSFTGLRVGLTCAKTICYVSGARLVPIGSMPLVASNLNAGTTCQVVYDAARKQVYVQSFRRDGSCWLETSEIEILLASDWARRLELSFESDGLTCGPGLEKYHGLISKQKLAAKPCWWPSATRLIDLAVRSSEVDSADFWTLEPLYVRPSAAEERLRSQ